MHSLLDVVRSVKGQVDMRFFFNSFLIFPKVNVLPDKPLPLVFTVVYVLCCILRGGGAEEGFSVIAWDE